MTSPESRARKNPFLRLGIYVGLLLLAGGYIFLCLRGQGLSCVFYENFGIRCPSCGSSRAALALLRLDFAEAARQNPFFAFAVYPIAGLIALQDIAVCLFNLLHGQARVSFLQFLLGKR